MFLIKEKPLMLSRVCKINIDENSGGDLSVILAFHIIFDVQQRHFDSKSIGDLT